MTSTIEPSLKLYEEVLEDEKIVRGLDKVEDPNDIHNVSTSVWTKAWIKEEKPIHQGVTDERKRESTSTKIYTTELPPHIHLEMPALSLTLNQGKIAKWRKRDGDKIEGNLV